jgi:hypothetical protein
MRVDVKAVSRETEFSSRGIHFSSGKRNEKWVG